MEKQNKTLQLIWNHKSSLIVEVILIKKNKAEGITLSGFKIYYKAIGIKTAWYWNGSRKIDPWNQNPQPRNKSIHL